MLQTLYFLVPPVTNWKSLLQFPSPDFCWFNNVPEFKHRHPSLSLTCTQSISKAWNYSWLGLEQPTRCQFYMFYKATACRKQLKCRSYQACDPQSNQRLPETVIQGSIIFLQEKWNICGPESISLLGLQGINTGLCKRDRRPPLLQWLVLCPVPLSYSLSRKCQV